ncbi:hypothetical protein [Solicola gregarius]|uniref:DUF4352 domain-containing protein n=1 Tax=Solicola gregarius TaxID=2908642 RepID=A0AA46TIA4_9ACTN|nr:hypothetical protein [Solicola gregarius]UYM05770.1 hypothetical protein L0C25_01445 [Solicola gregarius]
MLTRVGALVAAAALVLSGCSGGDDDPDPVPETPDIEVPEGVTLTAGGSTVDVGSPASVVYKPDNAAATVVTVRVERIDRGKPADLGGFDLDGVAKNSVPYYAHASIRNAGPAVLAHADAPLYGLDSGDEYFPPTKITGTVKSCKPLVLPEKLEQGRTAKGCLVFTVPPGKAFKGVQVRTSDLENPITWAP